MGWSAGALDGIGLGSGEDVDSAEAVADAIADLADQSSDDRAWRLYLLVARAEVLHSVDKILEGVVSRDCQRVRVEAIGLWLVTASPHRSAVKLGVALMGIAKTPQTDVLLTVGAHDEFSLFVAVALRNAGASERVLFDLAQRVHGWGRIQVVERLYGSTDPEIQHWMLVEGYKNAVMYEYLAMICARTGDLAAALGEQSVDEPLLAGAGDLIAALIAGGPTPTIRAYADGPQVVERYLAHVHERAGSLQQRSVVSSIRDALLDGEELPMDDQQRQTLIKVAEQFISRDHFAADVEVALREPDGQAFWDARSAARDLGIDIFDSVYWRIDNDIDENPHWSFLFESATPAQLADGLELGRRRLDLTGIASGPSNAIGMGPDFKKHMQLNWFLQALRKHPGEGWDFIAAGLRSPSIQNRNGALNALQAWPREQWPPLGQLAVANMIDVEVNPKVKLFAIDVLQGDVPTGLAWARTIETLRDNRPALADLATNISQIKHVTRLRSTSTSYGPIVIWNGTYDSIAWQSPRVTVGQETAGFFVTFASGQNEDETQRLEGLTADKASNHARELALGL